MSLAESRTSALNSKPFDFWSPSLTVTVLLVGSFGLASSVTATFLALDRVDVGREAETVVEKLRLQASLVADAGFGSGAEGFQNSRVSRGRRRSGRQRHSQRHTRAERMKDSMRLPYQEICGVIL